MLNVHAKRRQIDVLPDITGMLAFLHDFSQARKETSSNLHVNLANVRNADSIGIAILLGLIYLGKDNPEKYNIKFTLSDTSSVNQLLEQLGIINLVEKVNLNNNIKTTVDLFDDEGLEHAPSINVNYEKVNSESLQKVILFIPKDYKNRQEALDTFSRNLKKIILLDKPRNFNHEQIIKVFLELAKNTYDHSNGIGVVGLKITNDGIKKVQLVYCDTGEGICRSVRGYLATPSCWKENSSIKHLKEKGSFMDLLYLAFQAGFSTKLGNKVNHGMGLTLIAQGAIGCGFNVLLRDADSIINLSGIQEPYTHAKLRTRSSRTTAPKLLMFNFEKEVIV